MTLVTQAPQRAASAPAPAPPDAGLLPAVRRAAVINASLLKLVALDLPGLDLAAFRAAIDSATAHLDSAVSTADVRAAEESIAREVQGQHTRQVELIQARDDEFTATIAMLTEALGQLGDGCTFTEQVVQRSERMARMLASRFTTTGLLSEEVRRRRLRSSSISL